MRGDQLPLPKGLTENAVFRAFKRALKFYPVYLTVEPLAEVRYTLKAFHLDIGETVEVPKGYEWEFLGGIVKHTNLAITQFAIYTSRITAGYDQKRIFTQDYSAADSSVTENLDLKGHKILMRHPYTIALGGGVSTQWAEFHVKEHKVV